MKLHVVCVTKRYSDKGDRFFIFILKRMKMPTLLRPPRFERKFQKNELYVHTYILNRRKKILSLSLQSGWRLNGPMLIKTGGGQAENE